jgi:alanyl-tRNA synthetase
MKSSEIRKKFLEYFKNNGHEILPGSSLIPADPTVLLTLAGMLQFKPIFLGEEAPQYKRVTTVQKCLRMIDIENVGKTARHLTFFEMLGNFSFGDYFKKEVIPMAWDLLTKEYEIPAEKLSAAIYEKDDESFAIWEKEVGLPKERIFRLDEENNFWSVGPTGPCGPCSEIYYDFGIEKGCGKTDCQPGCECDRFLEVWNLVFIQYNRNEKGELVPLKTKGIDTGMGMERLTSILQGADNNFDTDLFTFIIQKIKSLAKDKTPPISSVRIIADHSRAMAHLISDGVMPGNAGRGYVLRRIIRRAIRHGKLIGINEPFLYLLSKEVVLEMKDVYPVLGEQENLIAEVIKTEEESFLQTLSKGIELFDQIRKEHEKDKIIPGKIAFQLHDTYGFPIELTREIAEENGFKIDEAGFEKEMEGQKGRAREAGISSEKEKIAKLDLAKIKPTKFVGYDKASVDTKVIAVFPKEKFVVLEKSPFYGESGGQVGDTGIIKAGDKDIHVIETLISPQGVILHEVDNTDGIKEKQKVRATIDLSRRIAIEVHHTSTHLLHKALKEVLGNHIKQAGSYVGPDKLRFDFNHFSALQPEEISKVEQIVNDQIKKKCKVEVLQKSYNDAVNMGAVALFGEKYGDKVRVVNVKDFSLELCGGAHIGSTEDILFFKIISESALGSGVRRIEAVAGEKAKVSIVYQAKALKDEVEEMIRKYRLLEVEKEQLGGKKFTETGIFEIELTELDGLIEAVDSQDSVNVKKFIDHFKGREEWLKERIAKAEKEINNLKLKRASGEASDYITEIKEIAGVKILTKELQENSMQMLRAISDQVRNQAKSCVVVLASAFPGRLIFLITVTQDLIDKGISAKKLADVFTRIVGGKGGGKEEKAEGGGKDPTKIKEALEAVCASLG